MQGCRPALVCSERYDPRTHETSMRCGYKSLTSSYGVEDHRLTPHNVPPYSFEILHVHRSAISQDLDPTVWDPEQTSSNHAAIAQLGRSECSFGQPGRSVRRLACVSQFSSHESPADTAPKPTLFSREFALDDRVAFVTGGHRGIGLEAALALVEAGARAVYCVDLPPSPSEDWEKVRDYASRMVGKSGEGRLEYISADVTNAVRNGRLNCASRDMSN